LREGQTGTQVIAGLRETGKAPAKAILITGDTSSPIHELPQDPNSADRRQAHQAEGLLKLARTPLISTDSGNKI